MRCKLRALARQLRSAACVREYEGAVDKLPVQTVGADRAADTSDKKVFLTGEWKMYNECRCSGEQSEKQSGALARGFLSSVSPVLAHRRYRLRFTSSTPCPNEKGSLERKAGTTRVRQLRIGSVTLAYQGRGLNREEVHEEWVCKRPQRWRGEQQAQH